MRDTIWNLARNRIPEGAVLPCWALAVRAVLYPLDFLYWRMSTTRGYQWERDCWLIEGATYSGKALSLLAKAQGETYRVTRTGETVTLERVSNTSSVMHEQVDRIGVLTGLLIRALPYVATNPDLTQPGGDELAAEIRAALAALPPGAGLFGVPQSQGAQHERK